MIYMEFGGGLGDILDQLYRDGTYNVLQRLSEHERADIYLVTHNPFAHELFAHHPKRAYMTVHSCGYWPPERDAYERDVRNMPAHGMNKYLPVVPGRIEFFPSPASVAVLQDVEPEYLVVAAGAGMAHRVLPDWLVDVVVRQLTAVTGMPIYFIGRTYDRDGRHEPTPPKDPQVVNLIDRLDIPGTCELVRNAKALVTAHSSMAILGWLENVPQLLLYPPDVWEHHAPNNTPDHWLRGVRSARTVHAAFEQYNTQHLLRFLKEAANAV